MIDGIALMSVVFDKLLDFALVAYACGVGYFLVVAVCYLIKDHKA